MATAEPYGRLYQMVEAMDGNTPLEGHEPEPHYKRQVYLHDGERKAKTTATS